MSNKLEFPEDPFGENENKDDGRLLIETSPFPSDPNNQSSSNSVPSSFPSRDLLFENCPCKHPFASFFHLIFKFLSIAAYLLLTFFTQNFILIFAICVLLLAFDFWTVKNITGRLLVGLRWSNVVQEDGTNVWKFESKPNREQVIAPIDSYIFWAGLVFFPIFWLLLCIISIIRFNFSWIIIILVAIFLSVTNLVGYFRCLKDAKQQIVSMVARQYVNYMFNSGSSNTSGTPSLLSRLVSRITG